VGPPRGPGRRGSAALEAPELTYRTVRPADRERVLEISQGVWEGGDYLPLVFDSWTSDPGATFQAAELDGVVVGLQRLRPIAPGILFYEGLRVAASHRRRGIARAMLRHALAEAREQGLSEMRLYTGSDAAAALFESEGFRRLFDCAVWSGGRVEGGDPPRYASAGEGARLAAQLDARALRAYGGVMASWYGTLDVDAALLERLAGEGLVRVGTGGRALALVREDARRRLPITFLSGASAAVHDLLTSLRFEADSLDLVGVALLAPVNHPAAGEIRESGYDLAEDEGHALGYALKLSD
jgi:GNAT superfamily N-acetyltransferase